MNSHERELLQQIQQGPLPMHLSYLPSVQAAKILKGLGYIDATVHEPNPKGAALHAGMQAMVIVSGVTSLGQSMNGM